MCLRVGVNLSSGTFICFKCVILSIVNIKMSEMRMILGIVGSAASGAVLLQENNTSHMCNLKYPSRGCRDISTERPFAALAEAPTG